MDISGHRGSRPLAVKISVCLLAVSGGTDLVRQIAWYRAHPSGDPGFYFSLVLVIVFLSVLLFFLFRGHNWARWLVVIDIVLGVILSLVVRHGHQQVVWYFAFTLINTVAVLALFLPPSNQWFTFR